MERVGKLILRVLAECLIWLPLWLLFTANMGLSDKLRLGMVILITIIAGLALNRLPALWRKVVVIVAIFALVAFGIVNYTDHLPILIWLGIMLWRGRYASLGYWHYGLGFGVCTLGLIAIAQNEAWTDYRLPLILLALAWVVVWFVALNRSLVQRAGLLSGIATKPVMRANSKYVMIFLAVSMLAIALTVGYGEKLLTPKQIVNPNNSWIDPERFIPPPQDAGRPEWLDQLGKPKKPSVVWDYLLGIVIVFAVIGLVRFVGLLWKDKNWTLKGILDAIKSWFLREKQQETLPYIEEQRSLRKEKKQGGGVLGGLLRRQPRRMDWERLSNPDKVRRLYEDAVAEGIRQGYEFRTSDTPSETLAALERWQADQVTATHKERQSDFGNWLHRVRNALASLYGKARYSPHNISSEDVEELHSGSPHRYK
ncbi:DUF4129 domain-containing protein [Cohnella terricola]|uniref:DUF4129 domain-containing protein n=1 Tax=Cohnella terricola TaxID=1289167 RepID=A0A559JAI3_9BACL|nr:DUF4129 domain-containing protein [Cohnella terricola]TVX96857.1 DUF4129 domain-containing protein [Cohnella terricola]